MEWTPGRIRKLRKQLGMTQKELATELGYSRYQTVSEFENGQHKPPPAVQKLLDMLDKQTEMNGA